MWPVYASELPYGVGCRVLDRCGDSLGHGITIIYTTNKDGESIDSLAVGPPSKRVVV